MHARNYPNSECKLKERKATNDPGLIAQEKCYRKEAREAVCYVHLVYVCLEG